MPRPGRGKSPDPLSRHGDEGNAARRGASVASVRSLGYAPPATRPVDRNEYPVPAFIHPLADVHTGQIGEGTRVWQFAVVLKGARIGRDCNICAHTLIEGRVVIGDAVTVKSGVYLWDGLVIEDEVFLGPNATFTNDPFPRSRQAVDYPVTTLKRGCSIGAGAIVLPGLTIGEDAMIGAGAVVTRSVPAGETWVGNPARALSHGRRS